MIKITLVSVLLAVLMVLPTSVNAKVIIKQDGNVYQQTAGVLGESDEKKQEEVKKEDTMKQEDKKDEKKQEEKKEEKREDTSTQKDQKNINTDEKKREAPLKQNEQKESEIKFKSNKETGRIKEVLIGRNKEKTEIQIEREKTEKREKVEDKELEVETDEGKVKIASGAAENELELEHDGVKARTNFPLRVNPETKKLSVTTQEGVKNVSVLPEKALQVISELGLVDAASGSSRMEMKVENGKLVYKIEGKKEKKLFGLFTYNVKQDAVVSAETGEVLGKSELSFFEKMLSLFAQ